MTLDPTAPLVVMPSTASRSPERVHAARRAAGVSGLVAVAGNVAGVAFLHDMPSAYRLARLGEWGDAVRAQPLATTASGVCFAVGLTALAHWVTALGREGGTPRARLGAWFAAATALLDGAGTLLPILPAVGLGAPLPLLHASLALDALFNLGLGVGLLAIGADLRERPLLRGLCIAAGLASVPVSA